MPLISVIIPTYNRARFVAKAIESVLRQNCADSEIILIDDGSTDDTTQALAPLRGRIRYFYQQNSGVSAARNSGIAAAKGKWIAFLDSDDEWMPGYLEWQMRRVRQFPEVVVHLTNALTIKPNRKKENHFQGTHLSAAFNGNGCLMLKAPLATVIRHRPWFLQSAIMRKDALVAAGLFDTSLRIAEDFDVIARIAKKGSFSICNKPLVCIYRREEETEHLSKIAVSDGLYSCESWGRVFARLRNHETLSHDERKALDAAMSENRRATANLMLRKGRPETARSYYFDALCIHPSLKSLGKYLLSLLPAGLAVKSIKKGIDVHPGRE